MPFSISRLPDGGVHVRYFGKVGGEDVLAAQEKNYGKSPNAVLAYPYVCGDWTEAEEVAIPTHILRKAAFNSRAALEANPNLLIVSIVPRDFVFGLGRMWQGFLSDAGSRTMICRSREEAEAWLRQNLKSSARS